MRITVDADKKNLWQAVNEQKKQTSYCSGNGQCGKCRVRVISGNASVSAADKKHLSQEEISDGYRIACQSRPLGECEIELFPYEKEEMKILAVSAETQKAGADRSCGIAIDIGSTTLAFALVDAEGAVLATEAGMNHQRSYGADVVSRISAALNGQEEELSQCIRKDIHTGIEKLLQKAKRCISDVTQIVVAGNTAMEQLFFGLPLKGLGNYPFLPYANGFLKTEYKNLYPSENESGNPGVIGFPCVAGFVGGDITAGLYELQSAFPPKEKMQGMQVFLDIGTNGELACILPEEIIVTSTAAGPVFEGASISCGMGCVPGAICATKIADDMLEYRTIEKKAAEGICGSGLIEAMADMLTLGIVDKTGSFLPGFQKSGYLLARTRAGTEIRLTQADIREFQMAKAAIAAGVELLIKESGYQGEVGRYILAGGFGNELSPVKAVKSGILPGNALGRCEGAGNTALKGAIRLLFEGSMGISRVESLLLKIRHLQLAQKQEFQECYLRHMEF